MERTELTPEQCIYAKSYECPVCGFNFKSKALRKGKVRYLESDLDLKSNCVPVQPDYYDVVVCEKCGYAALASKFEFVTDKQSKLIKENITPNYVHEKFPEVYNIDTAIRRYKQALLTCEIKKSKSGEKAFLCLKLAWIYRDKKDKENENIYLKKAYDGFNDAFINENFPICGLDENNLLYVLSAIAMDLGKDEQAIRTLSKLIIKKDISARLKSKAEDIKEIIKNRQ